MNKPTAQEVWERINRALETNSICAINLVSKKSTEEEAETHKARQEAIGRVTHAIIEANEGWDPDWGDYSQKFYIYQEGQDNSLHTSSNRTSKQPYILPYIRKEAIALSIISSHKEDLDLIFNVKK